MPCRIAALQECGVPGRRASLKSSSACGQSRTGAVRRLPGSWSRTKWNSPKINSPQAISSHAAPSLKLQRAFMRSTCADRARTSTSTPSTVCRRDRPHSSCTGNATCITSARSPRDGHRRQPESERIPSRSQWTSAVHGARPHWRPRPPNSMKDAIRGSFGRIVRSPIFGASVGYANSLRMGSYDDDIARSLGTARTTIRPALPSSSASMPNRPCVDMGPCTMADIGADQSAQHGCQRMPVLSLTGASSCAKWQTAAARLSSSPIKSPYPGYSRSLANGGYDGATYRPLAGAHRSPGGAAVSPSRATPHLSIAARAARNASRIGRSVHRIVTASHVRERSARKGD